MIHLTLAQVLAEKFGAFPQVEGVGVGGSLATGVADAGSDIDLYVFTTSTIPLAQRAALVDEMGALRADLDLTFWDLGDEWIHSGSSVEVDTIYWDMDWIQAQLDRVLVQHEASLGYTTSFWHTIRGLVVLFDRSGKLGDLKNQAAQPYPEPLRQAIIARNLPVLRQVIPSYAHQIARAVERGDRVSINHRVGALLASYFDILFAFNRTPHPGEKRLLEHAERLPIIPPAMRETVEAVLQSTDPSLNDHVDRLVTNLEKLFG